MELSELVQQLRFRLVDWKLLPLDVNRSGHIVGIVSLSGQQHSTFVFLQAEKHGPRLEFLGRRRVGVVGHGPVKVGPVGEALRLLLMLEEKIKVCLCLCV